MSNLLQWNSFNHQLPETDQQCLIKINDGDYDLYEIVFFKKNDIKYKYWLPIESVASIINAPDNCNCFKCVDTEDILDTYCHFKNELKTDPILHALFDQIHLVHFKKYPTRLQIEGTMQCTIRNKNFINVIEDAKFFWEPILRNKFQNYFKNVSMQFFLHLSPDNEPLVIGFSMDTFDIDPLNIKKKHEIVIEEPESHLYINESQIESLEKEVGLKKPKWIYKFKNIDYGVDDLDLFKAINKARELLHDGTKPDHANVKAADEYKVKSSDVAHHMGVISGVVRNARKAWKNKVQS